MKKIEPITDQMRIDALKRVEKQARKAFHKFHNSPEEQSDLNDLRITLKGLAVEQNQIILDDEDFTVKAYIDHIDSNFKSYQTKGSHSNYVLSSTSSGSLLRSFEVNSLIDNHIVDPDAFDKYQDN